MMNFDVFISYSSKDKAAADAACASLEAAGVRCWIAPRDVLPGADWGASIIEALDSCRAMVLIFSASANDSPQIRNEVVRAVNRGVPVIPVRIENVEPTKALAYFMGAVHWLDALTPPLEKHLKHLASSVRLLLNLTNSSASQSGVHEVEAPTQIPGPGPEPIKPPESIKPLDPVPQEHPRATEQSPGIARHIVGPFLIINGAFLAVFAATLIADAYTLNYVSGRDRDQIIAVLLALVPATLMVASGASTLLHQRWARALRIITCAIGAFITPVATAFFLYAFVHNLRSTGPLHFQELALSFVTSAYSGVLAICFIGILYDRGFDSWANRFRGYEGNGAFLLFLFALCVLTVVTLFGIGQYEYSPIHRYLWFWVAVQIVVDILISTYCYIRFRREHVTWPQARQVN
jgi:hypothetical protein